METIYVEQDIKEHPRVQKILARFNKAKNIIYCKHYGEVFNTKAQNFRLQKQQPALILARKMNRFVLPTPQGLGLENSHNYYFSHLLNCLYDCRYCFLQGLYPSAHYVLFINYEDFMQDIVKTCEDTQQSYTFFSGYDSDSLVFDDVSGFVDVFLPFFKQLPNATLELRTKSINIKSLLKHEASPNIVVAFSFTPQEISETVEHGVPSVAKRLKAMQQLAEHGYLIGLRFDPLIYAKDYQTFYKKLMESIFTSITQEQIHSVTIGLMRFPTAMYQKLVQLYPKDKLLAHPLEKRGNIISYSKERELEMQTFVHDNLSSYINPSKLFSCSAL